MAYFSWLERRRDLSDLALTVRAQVISPNDNGQLGYDAFAPFVDTNSTNIANLVGTDWRPVADRREWNTRGRHIPIKTGDKYEAQWVPIESYFTIAEQEINDLLNASNGSQQVLQDTIAASIPSRTDLLAEANFRRIDVDWFTAWGLNQISVKNPETGTTTTVSLGMSSTRYTTALTAWNDAGVNGYSKFLEWLETAEGLIGEVAGVMLRTATYEAIRIDAPNVFSPTSTLRMTKAQFRQAVEDELDHPFRFVINENSHDIFTDAGNDTTRVKIWPAQRVAAIPAGGRVGSTYRAPVARAWDLANAAPDAGIDVRGMTVFNEIGNGGRMLTVECQGNYLPLPDETKCCVIDAGV
jgi:hypothetical protein